MKGPTEKHFDGIYANPRLMHAVGLVVGCICHVQVKNGSIYEGVLKTLSSKADFVLEMARKIEKKNVNSGTMSVPSLTSLSNSEEMLGKMIFKIDDVVMMTCPNVDPDYATKETFTDTGISKFNGQVVERPLEPWDGGSNTDGLSDLGGGEEEANGWDPDDMFRTNEMKYGVKSSFDDNLPGYTIPLNKQNTEEYKQQEAKASKIAQEIESSLHYKNRAALENGDEEERFSAVVRPDNINNFRHVSYHRNRKPQNMRLRSTPAPPHLNRNTQVFHRISSPNSYKNTNSSVSAQPPRQSPMAQQSHYLQQPSPPQPTRERNTPPSTSAAASNASPQEDSPKMNGEVEKNDIKYTPKPPRSLNLQNNANKEMRESVISQQNLNKNSERRKDVDRKSSVQKAREEKTADFKRFQEKFKLPEEPNKDVHEKESPPPSNITVSPKEKSKEEERKTTTPTSSENLKSSTLNPNAKEFVFNPNAKTFTPRGIPVAVPQPPRLHTQSPILAVPQPHLVPQTAVFNMAPHYVTPFTPAASVTQAPRFRKALPMTLQRHDLPQQVHVQAATGQPILAQPQFTIQYTPSAGMLHHPAGPPQQLAYAQMYSLMPRVLTPQPVGMVPTSAAYGENPQMPTHVYMHHPGTQPLPHPGGGQQHSTPSTPQSQTPSGLHPAAPSPVHQGAPPTPTGTPLPSHNNAPTPQPVMYAHHPIHAATSQAAAFAAASYAAAGTPQQIVLLPQQHHGGPFNHLHHSSTGPVNHVGTPTHVLSHHAPLAMIPTSAGMVHPAAQAAMGSGHYVPHSQV